MMANQHMLIQLLGIFGVVLLLAAFILNLLRRIDESSSIYLWMNIVGAAMSAVYAFYLRAYPFVVLESVWGISALVRLILSKKKAS
jgi:hypothetical protein